MTLVCAWCDRCLGETLPLSKPGVTHGMCARCLSDRLAPREETFRFIPEPPARIATPPSPAF